MGVSNIYFSITTSKGISYAVQNKSLYVSAQVVPLMYQQPLTHPTYSYMVLPSHCHVLLAEEYD